jgi:hypothetical protein
MLIMNSFKIYTKNETRVYHSSEDVYEEILGCDAVWVDASIPEKCAVSTLFPELITNDLTIPTNCRSKQIVHFP